MLQRELGNAFRCGGAAAPRHSGQDRELDGHFLRRRYHVSPRAFRSPFGPVRLRSAKAPLHLAALFVLQLGFARALFLHPHHSNDQVYDDGWVLGAGRSSEHVCVPLLHEAVYRGWLLASSLPDGRHHVPLLGDAGHRWERENQADAGASGDRAHLGRHAPGGIQAVGDAGSSLDKRECRVLPLFCRQGMPRPQAADVGGHQAVAPVHRLLRVHLVWHQPEHNPDVRTGLRSNLQWHLRVG
mmetsp:Transcript_50316/g.97160  ORF Transcript_50316/g.97160 Transcript_50316/m.97160 type:complete len:241 (-) Transcript_50316:199-921(-)